MDEQLIQTVTAKANTWLGEEYDAETRAAVQEMLNKEDKTDLIECFLPRPRIWYRRPSRHHGRRHKQNEHIHPLVQPHRDLATTLKQEFCQYPTDFRSHRLRLPQQQS